MTALISAYARAYHALYDEPKIFDDFLARQMLTDEQFDGISGHMAQGISFFNPGEAHLFPDTASALRWVIQTQIAPHILARSRYTEDRLAAAMASGAGQYVLLGAGYDTFAFRNPDAPKNLQVFEVDHPATQTAKANRIGALGWEIPASLHFVAFDFAGEGLGQALLASGYDPAVPALFSWLGVTYYLTEEEILRTLSAVSSVSSPGSSIVFDYPDDGLFDDDAPGRVRRMVALANASGEPMRTALSLTELTAVLDQTDFSIQEHLTPAGIQSRYFSGRFDAYYAFENIHFVQAQIRE